MAVEDIKDTSILNTNLRKEHEDDKQGILDVRVRMNNNLEIDIEIQISELKVWAGPFLVLSCKDVCRADFTRTGL